LIVVSDIPEAWRRIKPVPLAKGVFAFTAGRVPGRTYPAMVCPGSSVGTLTSAVPMGGGAGKRTLVWKFAGAACPVKVPAPPAILTLYPAPWKRALLLVAKVLRTWTRP
jgi:hypothetical protein